MLDSYSRSSVGLSGGSSGILNNNSNAIGDDSSGSEDASESPTHAPVQFILGGAPTPSLKSATSTAPATGVASRAGAAVNHSSLDVNSSNHIGNLGNSTNAIGISGVASVNAPNATTPPLPPPNNAYNSSYFLNDR